jgi:hypothetical protein
MHEHIKSWYGVDIGNLSLLSGSFVWPAVKLVRGRAEIQVQDPGTVLSQAFLSYMAERSLPIQSLIIFRREPGSDHRWAHIDITAQRQMPFAALNWAYEDGTTEMVWYHPPAAQPRDDQRFSVSHGKGYSFVFRCDELIERERFHVGTTPMLVRTDIPHNILVGNSPRWCISARFGINRFGSWEDAIQTLGAQGLIDIHE